MLGDSKGEKLRTKSELEEDRRGRRPLKTNANTMISPDESEPTVTQVRGTMVTTTNTLESAKYLRFNFEAWMLTFVA